MRRALFRKVALIAAPVGLILFLVAFGMGMSVTPDGRWDATKRWTLTPDRQHTIPFNQHGSTVYVTDADNRLMDLMWWLGTPALLIGMGAIIFLKHDEDERE